MMSSCHFFGIFILTRTALATVLIKLLGLGHKFSSLWFLLISARWLNHKDGLRSFNLLIGTVRKCCCSWALSDANDIKKFQNLWKAVSTERELFPVSIDTTFNLDAVNIIGNAVPQNVLGSLELVGDPSSVLKGIHMVFYTNVTEITVKTEWKRELWFCTNSHDVKWMRDYWGLHYFSWYCAYTVHIPKWLKARISLYHHTAKPAEHE